MTLIMKSSRFITVDRVIGGLPPANHDGTFSHGTVRDLTLVSLNDERNALVHQVVQVRWLTRHFRHHANLKPEKKDSQPFFSTHHNQKHYFHSPTTGDP